MSSIKKILYYSQVDPSIPGGPNINEYEFTKVLSERFGTNAWLAIPETRNPVPHLANCNVIPVPRLRISYNIPSLFMRSRETAKHLVRKMHKKDIDLLVTRMTPYPTVQWFLSHKIPQRMVLKTVGQYWDFAPPPNIVANMFNSLNQHLYTTTIDKALAMDTVTIQFKAQLDKITGDSDKCIHIDNATSVETFKPTDTRPIVGGLDLQGRWPVLGYCGTHPSDRGARQLVELAERLHPLYPKLSVVVLGWDEQMKEIQSNAQKKGIRDRCHFVGMRPYSEVPLHINMMDLCYAMVPDAIASVVGNSSQKIRQYLACGRPVIATPHGSEYLTEMDLGSRVFAEDIDGLETATKEWLKRLEQERPSISQRAREYAVKELSVEKALERRLVFWDKKLNESPCAS